MKVKIPRKAILPALLYRIVYGDTFSDENFSKFVKDTLGITVERIPDGRFVIDREELSALIKDEHQTLSLIEEIITGKMGLLLSLIEVENKEKRINNLKR